MATDLSAFAFVSALGPTAIELVPPAIASASVELALKYLRPGLVTSRPSVVLRVLIVLMRLLRAVSAASEAVLFAVI